MPKTSLKTKQKTPTKDTKVNKKDKNLPVDLVNDPVIPDDIPVVEDILLDEVDPTEVEEALPEELRPKKKTPQKAIIDYVPELERDIDDF